MNNDQPWLYLENRIGSKNRWAVVQLAGKESNRQGIGARVRLVAGGRAQVREIHAGSGYLSSPPPEAHFGLGQATRIERIEVRWPSGKRQTLEGLAANRVIRIAEGGAWSYWTPAPTSRPPRGQR